MAKKTLHMRSNVILSDGTPKLPTKEQIEYGEIAVNYADGHETLSIKNSKNEIATFSNDEQLQNSVSLTYSELVSLKENSKLIPGCRYRITDYHTTTTQDETQSADHQFDIIVVADDETTLNENAHAIQHNGDTYFKDAKLSAWELKYDINNDISRYEWADAKNGKGVIYYMKDEWNNECPYDFKNIQFKRHAVSDTTSDKILSHLNGTYIGFVGGMNGLTIDVDSNFIWAYTFSEVYAELNNEDVTYNLQIQYDASLNNHTNEIDEDGGGYSHPVLCCKKNIINTYHISTVIDEKTTQVKQALNNIVLYNYPKYSFGENVWDSNRIEYLYCCENTFNTDCCFITSNGRFVGNSIGRCVYDVIFGNNCYSNTFGNNCNSNTFGDDCYSNTFGNNCNSNTFGDDCYYNTFGNNCNSNTFGNHCNSNTFGNHCYSNTFGNNCYSNTFGDDCYSNTLGNDYCYYNTFNNGVNYVTLKTEGNTNTNNHLKNVTILKGVTQKTINIDSNNLNSTSEIEVGSKITIEV